MNSIQVFIHDPLYKWALSPLKALQRQKVFQKFYDFLFHYKKIQGEQHLFALPRKREGGEITKIENNNNK